MRRIILDSKLTWRRLKQKAFEKRSDMLYTGLIK